MKTKILPIILLTVAVIASSCKKLDNLLTFYIPLETEITIENNTGINLPFEIPTPDITTNSDKEFKNNNTKTDLVKNVSLEELKLTIVSPSDITFSFLKSVHIYISTNSDDEVVLAYKEDIDSDAKSIELTPTNNKLDKYIKAESYKLRTKVVTRETLTKDITVKINMKFKVTADPL